MTSASKLFNTRRVRFGARNADTPSRTTVDRRNHHRNLGSCNPNPRPIHTHEEGHTQLPPGSIINSEDFRSIRRLGATENDRLPGVVLLARERLLQRLRGVHVTENRQSNTSSSSSSSIHQQDSTYNIFLETDTHPVQESVSESWQSVMPLSSMTRMLPDGLSQHELNLLSVTVFKNGNTASSECSICLEGFEDGDKLIKLTCMHTFHSCCLLPWVQVCGACPNCRNDVVVTSSS